MTGTFFVNEDGNLVLTGEKSKTPNTAVWDISVPESGTYFLGATYRGSDPVPAIIYINDKKVTENFGFLATTGDRIGKHYFPVYLEKGKNVLKFEIQGRRTNAIHNLAILREIKKIKQ